MNHIDDPIGYMIDFCEAGVATQAQLFGIPYSKIDGSQWRDLHSRAQKELEQLRSIEQAAKECPYKWRLKCCGMWTDIEKDVCFCCNCGDSTSTEKVLP